MPFQLPVNWKAVEVLDFFFKIHYILELNFHPALQNMITFLQNYFYKSANIKKPTQAMKELINFLKVSTDTVDQRP